MFYIIFYVTVTLYVYVQNKGKGANSDLVVYLLVWIYSTVKKF